MVNRLSGKTLVRADIVIKAKLDLEEFNADIDEVPDIVSDYISDLLYDVGGIEPVSVNVRTKT